MDSIKLTKLQKKEMKNLMGGEPPKCSCTCDCSCPSCGDETTGQLAGANQSSHISISTCMSIDTASSESKNTTPGNPGTPQQ